jgi:hypothetical protein
MYIDIFPLASFDQEISQGKRAVNTHIYSAKLFFSFVLCKHHVNLLLQNIKFMWRFH